MYYPTHKSESQPYPQPSIICTLNQQDINFSLTFFPLAFFSQPCVFDSKSQSLGCPAFTPHVGKCLSHHKLLPYQGHNSELSRWLGRAEAAPTIQLPRAHLRPELCSFQASIQESFWPNRTQ